MPAITRHVLDLALDDQAEWERAGTAVPVQVNLTARDLLEPDFASTLAERLERRGAPGTVLGVEITENDLLEDPKQACGTVAALNDLGVNVALDDFGTGYSSLARLRDLPIDEVKVDRSFISTMTEDHSSRSIVKATVDLAHDLGARVVAEGVEDAATRSVLSGLGCDDEQGYLLARPMPPAELRDWLAARPLVPLAA
jgi:EAL domain-containing protein (putative c-di-GMP-specific phosphodiesterase class I)